MSTININFSSGIPPYDQIRVQLAHLIIDHGLTPDQKLPTVRELASRLGVASGTVARAYRDLEAAHYIVTRGRHGTFVATTLPQPAPWLHATSEATQSADMTTADTPPTEVPSSATPGDKPSTLPQHVALQLDAVVASAQAAGVTLNQLVSALTERGNHSVSR